MDSGTPLGLLTYFGTLLYIDPGEDHCGMGLWARSLAIITLMVDGQRARFLHGLQAGAGDAVVLFRERGTLVGGGAVSASNQEFLVQPLRDGSLALTLGGLFGAAEPDGRITLSRTQARE